MQDSRDDFSSSSLYIVEILDTISTAVFILQLLLIVEDNDMINFFRSIFFYYHYYLLLFLKVGNNSIVEN